MDTTCAGPLAAMGSTVADRVTISPPQNQASDEGERESVVNIREEF